MGVLGPKRYLMRIPNCISRLLLRGLESLHNSRVVSLHLAQLRPQQTFNLGARRLRARRLLLPGGHGNTAQGIKKTVNMLG